MKKYIILTLISLLFSCDQQEDFKLSEVSELTFSFPHDNTKTEYLSEDKMIIDQVINALNKRIKTKEHKGIFLGRLTINSKRYTLLESEQTGYFEIIIDKKFYKVKLTKVLTEIIKKKD